MPASCKVYCNSLSAALLLARVLEFLDSVIFVLRESAKFLVRLPGACFCKSTPDAARV